MVRCHRIDRIMVPPLDINILSPSSIQGRPCSQTGVLDHVRLKWKSVTFLVQTGHFEPSMSKMQVQ